MTEIGADAAVAALLEPWAGPHGGLPPFDAATPETIERAHAAALAIKRGEIAAVAADPDPPSFANTIEALEDAGRALARVECLRHVFASTMSLGAMREAAERMAAAAAALDDEIAHDPALFARVEAVAAAPPAELTAEQARLLELIRVRFVRRGAGLAEAPKRRLAEVNARISALEAAFLRNMIAEQDGAMLLLDSASELEGLDEAYLAAAAAEAEALGHPGRWAVRNRRPSVWPVLTRAERRDVRERVWRMWSGRNAGGGPYDNRAVIAELIALRGEKARLLGFPTFARYVLADRMARTPEAAEAAMLRVWDSVVGPARAQLDELQALADRDGGGAPLAPWDRLFYAERLRRARFGLDAEAVRAHLPLDAVLDAMFDAAGRAFGLSFAPMPDAPVCAPGVRVLEVRRAAGTVGVLWLDLLNRPGKMMGSWSAGYRSHETFRGRVVPLAGVMSNLRPAADGEPVLLGWEYANVLFHEMGHALHCLLCRASYPSLGHTSVPWDFVELPSLLNERWLLDRDLLGRFARHHRTGAPMPPAMIDAIEQGLRYDRVFSLGLDFLGCAIVDMRLHSAPEGAEVDAAELERETYAALGMPAAIDPLLPLASSFHVFAGPYPAGLYVYLWGEIMAADAAEAFLEAPGGFYDETAAALWERAVLGAGATAPAEQAFRTFRGRDPDPDALLRRFGLLAAPAA